VSGGGGGHLFKTTSPKRGLLASAKNAAACSPVHSLAKHRAVCSDEDAGNALLACSKDLF